MVFRSAHLRGLGGQEGAREQRTGDSDGSGDDAPDAEAVIEGADGGLADGVGRGALAVSGEVAGDTERCPDRLVDEVCQGVRQRRGKDVVSREAYSEA